MTHGIHSSDPLGPSDSSDSGSDLAGTGERRSADGDETPREAADIAPDRVVTDREREIGDTIEADEDTDLDLIDEARADALPDDDLPGEDGPGQDEPGDDNPGDPRRDGDKPVAVALPM
jgi:hypothetical protein